MRQFVIPEIFFKSIAERGKLYSRFWMYWLGNCMDDIFCEDFLEKQANIYKEISKSEIEKIYKFGLQHLQQDFKIVKNKKEVLPNDKLLLAGSVIDYLNEVGNKTFSKKEYNIKHIIARINDGYVFDDFKSVIDKKVFDWKGTNFEQYIRPMTLFSNKQFENYLQAKTIKKTSFDQFALSVAKAQSINFRKNN